MSVAMQVITHNLTNQCGFNLLWIFPNFPKDTLFPLHLPPARKIMHSIAQVVASISYWNWKPSDDLLLLYWEVEWLTNQKFRCFDI